MILPHQELTRSPAVCAIVPARNEADVLPMTLRSLLQPFNLGLSLLVNFSGREVLDHLLI